MTTSDVVAETGEGAQLIADLIQQGKVPLKIVTGTQTSQGIKFEAGSVSVAENATAIFVCG